MRCRSEKKQQSSAKFAVILTVVVVVLLAAIVIINNKTEQGNDAVSGQPSIKGQPVLGKDDAPVTVVEFEITNVRLARCLTVTSFQKYKRLY